MIYSGFSFWYGDLAIPNSPSRQLMLGNECALGNHMISSGTGHPKVGHTFLVDAILSCSYPTPYAVL